jgi:hypothetical protein
VLSHPKFFGSSNLPSFYCPIRFFRPDIALFLSMLYPLIHSQQMGLAEHSHHPPHCRRRPHQSHHQETANRRRHCPRLTKIQPPQTSSPSTPLPHRSPCKLAPPTTSPQFRALAAQSHLLRRRRLPRLDPLDGTALGTARRQWAAGRALGGNGRGHANGEEECESPCARSSA